MLLIVFGSIETCCTQITKNFVDTTKEWLNTYSNTYIKHNKTLNSGGWKVGTTPIYLKIQGDTTINDKKYSILRYLSYDGWTEVPQSRNYDNPTKKYFVREDSARVYLLYDSSDRYIYTEEDTSYIREEIIQKDKECILYDFSLNVGDTFIKPILFGDMNDGYNYDGFFPKNAGMNREYCIRIVIETGTVDIDGTLLRMIVLQGPLGKEQWIEGIGAVVGAATLYHGILPANMQHRMYFRCCTQNDNNLYGTACFPKDDSSYLADIEEASMIQVFPNPVKKSMQIEYSFVNKISYTFHLYDMNGMEIFRETLQGTTGHKNIDIKHLETGIYFYKIIGGENIIQSDKLVILQ